MTQSVDDPHRALLQHGLALQRAGRRHEAAQAYRSVVQAAPRHALAWHLLGTVVGQLGRWDEAAALLRRSLDLNPADPMAWNNLATALLDAADTRGALDAAAQALALAPDYAAAWFSWASAAAGDGRHAEALPAFRRVVQAQPGHVLAWAGLWRAAAAACDWPAREEAAAHVLQALASGQDAAMPPFDALALVDDPAVHLRCARAASQRLAAQEGLVPKAHGTPRFPQRIRLAYLSADFHEHATAYLMAELFERHDRQRFELIAVSFGPDDGSPMRARLAQAFDAWWDVRALSHEAVAQRMAEARVDIAVDLKGFTRGSRSSILQRKPAPVVVSYLGYPGTMGDAAYDYLIGDAVVTPPSHAAFYAEKLVQMPHSYQVNDTHRPIAADAPGRAEEGLPPQGVVFAAFNNVYKITPEFFQAWMRLLAAVPGSVLWLLSESEAVRANLRTQAQACGVDPQRLVFARQLPLDRHLARHVHADLLLDTLPYNAHTTTSDALWAGVPVVTCVGRAFAGRVAASLLQAAELPELVAQSLPEYEALALRLARDPAERQRLRARLLARRDALPLFDTARFTAHLEAAFEHMYRRWQQGLPPEGFAVADLAAHPAA